MVSIHVHKAIDKANKLGALAGAPETFHLWELPKREILEIALRFALQMSGDGETSCAELVEHVDKELRILRDNKII